MLQRIQSIWLLLAAAFAAITFKFPFYTGNRIIDGTDTTTNTTGVPPASVFANLDATTSIWLSILTVLAGVIAFVTIFLFDNRKLQLKLTYLGIFLSVILLMIYFIEMTSHFTTGAISLWCIFYFAILGFYILAARGIWKDDKLVKSMDRLR
jgi:hypothetical protein